MQQTWSGDQPKLGKPHVPQGTGGAPVLAHKVSMPPELDPSG